MSINNTQLDEMTPTENADNENVPERQRNWHFLQEFASTFELETFLVTYSHKMTSTHGRQASSCTFHSTQKHKQVYGYYKCTSSKCIKLKEDTCRFQFRINECSLDKMIRIYQLGTHSDRYENEEDNKRPGISRFYKTEIKKLMADEEVKTPNALLRTLTKRHAEGVYDLSIPLPTLNQIRGYKRRNNEANDQSNNEEFAAHYDEQIANPSCLQPMPLTTASDDEYEEVMHLVNELSKDIGELARTCSAVVERVKRLKRKPMVITDGDEPDDLIMMPKKAKGRPAKRKVGDGL